MNIEHWISEVSKAYQLADKKIAPNYRYHLEAQVSDTITTPEREFNSEVLEVMTYYFFNKATIGETFGPLNRINDKFGKSLEENYGLKDGPFINLARTYWTYKIEVQDLFPEKHNVIISQILMELEDRIACIFFPTPGPVKISDKERKMSQEKILKKYAPEINIDDFLSNNPILDTPVANEQEVINVYRNRPILKVIGNFWGSLF